MSDITNQNIVMDLVGIPNHVIRSSSSGRCGVSRHGDVVVALEHASFISNLDTHMNKAGHI